MYLLSSCVCVIIGSILHLFIRKFVCIFTEYTHHARIEIAKNGYRHLFLNGYTFGETKVQSEHISWRCTANIFDINRKSKRCATQITTKVLNGYEMIRNPYVKHSHPTKKKYKRSYN